MDENLETLKGNIVPTCVFKACFNAFGIMFPTSAHIRPCVVIIHSHPKSCPQQLPTMTMHHQRFTIAQLLMYVMDFCPR
jgi:hypothetical protein